jgi:hypothetical protein
LDVFFLGKLVYGGSFFRGLLSGSNIFNDFPCWSMFQLCALIFHMDFIEYIESSNTFQHFLHSFHTFSTPKCFCNGAISLLQDFILATWTMALAWSLGSSCPAKQSEISAWCLQRMKQLPEAQLYRQNLFHTQLG